MIKEEKEMIDRNIELSVEFSRYLFEHPEIEDKIPINAEMILLPDFDKELKKFNIALEKNMEAEGEKAIYVTIKHMRPQSLSRIEEIELKSVV